MTVVDDLALLAKLLPTSLRSRYRVQLLWAADVNMDIGFKFSLREGLDNEKEDTDLQLRDFNFNQSSAAATCVLSAEERIFTPEMQEPNPGRLDADVGPDVGDQQGFIASRKEKMKCEECKWEGNRRGYGWHVKNIHGMQPKLTRCEKCGVKCYTAWFAYHKCRRLLKTLSDGYERKRRGGETCGTCGLKFTDIRSHVLSRHTNKEQYLQKHYNLVNKDKDLKKGHNCHCCGKHFSTTAYLWKHVSRIHGVVTNEEIREVVLGKTLGDDNSLEKDATSGIMGKTMVEDKSLEKHATIAELDSVENDMSRSGPVAVAEEVHRSGDGNKEKKNGSNVEGSGNLLEEGKTQPDIVGGGKRSNSKRKREKRALREASPVCDYERIRAANIAERMKLFRTLDIEGALASAKMGFL